MAEPTAAHRATVALHRAGHLKRWFQQNHDGLPQKAGLPQVPPPLLLGRPLSMLSARVSRVSTQRAGKKTQTNF